MCTQAATADESLSRERAQNDDILCIVCMENQRNVVFCNCGHLVRTYYRALLMSRLQAVSPACNTNCLQFDATPELVIRSDPSPCTLKHLARSALS